MSKTLYDIPKGQMSLEEYSLFLEEHYSFSQQIERIKLVVKDVIPLVVQNHLRGFDVISIGNFSKVADIKPDMRGELKDCFSEALEERGFHLREYTHNFDEDTIILKWEEINV